MRGYYRNTKIVAILGRSNQPSEKLGQLIVAGVHVTRFNAAHGTDNWVKSLVVTSRDVSRRSSGK